MPEPLSPERLAVVAALADAHLDGQAAAPACLLRVRLVGPEVELGWLPTTDGGHPVDQLVGATAPADWRAVGVHAAGRGRSVDDDDDDGIAVRTTLLVGRDGGWAYRWSATTTGEITTGCGPAGDPAQPAGRLDDACRRALGLATAPPATGTDILWATQWLDELVERAASAACQRRVTSWPEIAALHPAVQALVPVPAPGDLSPDAVGRHARRLARWRNWAALRDACAGARAGAERLVAMAPGVARWLDDGSFSRWVFGDYPDLDDLRAAVADLLPPALAAAVEATLAASDLEVASS